MTKEEIILYSKELLKKMGYKKRNTTWVKKVDEEIFIVVNIQGSQFDKSDFYINLGVYIRPLGNKEMPAISDCHLSERINADIDLNSLFEGIVKKWEEWYGTSEAIYARALTGKMPMFTDKRVYGYFLVRGKG